MAIGYDMGKKKKEIEEKRKKRKAAEALAKAQAEERKKALTFSHQELLLKNMKFVMNATAPIFRAGNDIVLSSFENTAALERNKYVLPTVGIAPEDVTSSLLNPTNMKPLLQATPAQLGSLEPTLRFFIVAEKNIIKTVNKKKVVDRKYQQEEIFFSDFTSAERIVKLANARASRKIDKTLKRGGTEAGIKSFTWRYDNKHEGDKIIKAKLELYFGTLSELVNQDYLKFMFTNGRKTVNAASVSNDIGDKIAFLKKNNKTLFDCLKPGKNAPEVDDKASNDFRQLKVLVGWAVPSGREAELQRIYSSNMHPNAKTRAKKRAKDLEDFKEAVRNTQTTILLNLVDYNVNFSQEGPTTLTLEYVGSSDNYLSSGESDVLGQNNFSKGNLNSQQVLVSAEEIDVKSLLKDGYLEHQMKNFSTLVSETTLVPVNLKRLKREADYLDGERQLILTTLGDSKPTAGDKKKLDKLDSQMNLVETVYGRAKKSLRIERYASLINNLIGETGNTSRVYVAHGFANTENVIELDFAKKVKGAGKGTAAKLLGLAKMSDADKIDYLKKNSLAKDVTFKRGDKEPLDDEDAVPIPYVFLGDILLAAMQNAEIREDIKFITGTFSPKKLGVPGFENDNTNYSLYDIPIALDYLSQFIYDNIIARNVDEYPFRQFLDGLLAAVGRLLNSLSSFKFRINFDYTLYMTEEEIKTEGEVALATGQATIVKSKLLLLDKDRLKTIKPRLLAPSYSKKIKSYYVLYTRQTNAKYEGKRVDDEKRGIYHYVLGADRGIAKTFDFSKQDVPQFKAMSIENIRTGPDGANFGRALVLPQNVSIKMYGNNIHRNGDLIYVDSRALLGEYANQILTLGGYYRVVRSNHSITNRGFESTIDAYFQHRTHGIQL